MCQKTAVMSVLGKDNGYYIHTKASVKVTNIHTNKFLTTLSHVHKRE